MSPGFDENSQLCIYSWLQHESYHECNHKHNNEWASRMLCTCKTHSVIICLDYRRHYHLIFLQLNKFFSTDMCWWWHEQCNFCNKDKSTMTLASLKMEVQKWHNVLTISVSPDTRNKGFYWCFGLQIVLHRAVNLHLQQKQDNSQLWSHLQNWALLKALGQQHQLLHAGGI